MQISTNYIERKFHEYNELIFEGKLPLPDITLSPARTFLGKLRYSKKRNLWGKWKYSNFRLVISTYFDLPENMVDDTIIHEMIHYHILYHHIKDTSSHGTVFRGIMQQINERYGRRITISCRLPENAQRTRQKQQARVICVSHFNDGRVGVTILARTRILELWQCLSTIPDIADCQCYISDNPFFNKYPRSVTPKIYHITQAELDTNLIGSKQLDMAHMP